MGWEARGEWWWRGLTNKVVRAWAEYEKRRRRRRKVKERYWLGGARRAICRHSAHNVPSMPVGHVKTAPSITLHTGQGERARPRETDGPTENVRRWRERQRQIKPQRSHCRCGQEPWGSEKRRKEWRGQEEKKTQGPTTFNVRFLSAWVKGNCTSLGSPSLARLSWKASSGFSFG